MNDESKQKNVYTIDLCDTSTFRGFRTETVYGYAYALTEQFLSIRTLDGGRAHYNWNMVQSFKSSPWEPGNE